ncbi:hypothetical protein [Humisphaera borealis]|uniref:Uncharacterized protein n=1 Tax=Humisphaera borealis TaxID=2807512 RepID=A0A7M2X2C0_9BACT|nr:hypothetical protein [Humisphaera borealis]QOV91814.1 hypothetical protein IPV69_10855 [Humisphaera borealis]
MSSNPTTEPSSPATGQVRSNGSARLGRLGIVGLLILGLVISGLSRQWAMGLQRQAYMAGPYAPSEGAGADDTSAAGTAGPTLGSLDSYFLILLLGGLRGPLVMFLWTSSESQKNERDLEDFDTKVELIRLLQPEFDSVHIFQMWNKAYNISAQIASLPNKYAIILDAVEYGRKVDKSRPNNLNILLELNKIFQHKLGSTAGDSIYYTRQVRADSKWRESTGDSVGALNQRMPPVLDKDGRVLAPLVKPRSPRPTDMTTRIALLTSDIPALKAAAATAGVSLPDGQLSPPAGTKELVIAVPESTALKIEPLLYRHIGIRFVYADWNDGSDLQYLKRYEPYPDGVSPLALGFNYGKRAQVLMNRTGQRPAQSGPSVVDSRPGLELRQWGESEWDRGMVAEARAFGRKVTQQRHTSLIPTASVSPSAVPQDIAAAREAVASLELANRLARDARAEYTRHLINPTETIRRMQDYTSHLDGLEADEIMTRADLAYLRSILSNNPAEKRVLLEQARTDYVNAEARYQALELRFYTPGESEPILFPPNALSRRLAFIPDWRYLLNMAGMPHGITRETAKDYIDQPKALATLYAFVRVSLESLAGIDQNSDSRAENGYFVQRAALRLMQIDIAAAKMPVTASAR